jgi:hypothetical protein
MKKKEGKVFKERKGWEGREKERHVARKKEMRG